MGRAFGRAGSFRNGILTGLLLVCLAGCDCSGHFSVDGPDDNESADIPTEHDYLEDETGLDSTPQDLDADPVPDFAPEPAETIPEMEEEEPGGGCTGEYAYLHGDLWPMWYNMRVACDPEHKAWWRCVRIRGEGDPECTRLQSHYEECIATWGSPWPCLNWGVCAPVEGTVCGVGDPPEECDTRIFDYDSEEIWGSYYGLTWDAHTDLHRFLTIHVKDASGGLIISFSARPGSEEAYMDGLDNSGIGLEPQGFIQIIRDGKPEKFTDKFGAFACIRLPAGEELVLQAAWLNEFCHTCGNDYASYPDTPCRTDDISMSFEPGRHYLWTERGIELMDGCSGPPPSIAEKLPEAACDTSGP